MSSGRRAWGPGEPRATVAPRLNRQTIAPAAGVVAGLGYGRPAYPSRTAMPPSEQDRTRPAPRRSQPLGCPRRSICSPVAPPGADSGAPADHPDHQGGNPAMGAAQTHEYVDRRYEDREVNELPDAPVEALRGLGKRGGEALRKA